MDFEEILAALVEGDAALPGFSHPALAAVRLLEHMVDLAAGPGMHVFVSHDSIVLPTAAHLLGQSLTRPDWPEYLDAVVLWRDIDAVEVRYRGRSARRRQLVR